MRSKLNLFKIKFDTKFQGSKLPNERYQYLCLSIIVIDSFFRGSKKYYPQALLEECKYKIKEGERKC